MAKTFKEVWAEKQAEGYQYGEDALEHVRLGWELAQNALRGPATPTPNCQGIIPGTVIMCGEGGHYCSTACTLAKDGHTWVRRFERNGLNIPERCNACGEPLLFECLFVEDGCPCNSPRGINFPPKPCSLCGEDCTRPGHHLREILGDVTTDADDKARKEGRVSGLNEALRACEKQRLDRDMAYSSNDEYRRGQYRGADDCCMVVRHLLKGAMK